MPFVQSWSALRRRCSDRNSSRIVTRAKKDNIIAPTRATSLFALRVSEPSIAVADDHKRTRRGSTRVRHTRRRLAKRLSACRFLDCSQTPDDANQHFAVRNLRASARRRGRRSCQSANALVSIPSGITGELLAPPDAKRSLDLTELLIADHDDAIRSQPGQ